jgi:hypothetical protein
MLMPIKTHGGGRADDDIGRKWEQMLAGSSAPPTPKTAPSRWLRGGRRMLDETRHDPYQATRKTAGPAHCTECGAVHERGRWRWGDSPAGAREEVCPACRRTKDHMPAGRLVLEGPCVASAHDEVLALVRHVAQHERDEHPLNRILEIDDRGDRIEILTTDIHLPQRIGEALKNAHHGNLSVRYGRDEYSVRIRWCG